MLALEPSAKRKRVKRSSDVTFSEAPADMCHMRKILYERAVSLLDQYQSQNKLKKDVTKVKDSQRSNNKQHNNHRNNHRDNHKHRPSCHHNNHNNRIDKNRGKKPQVKVTRTKHQSMSTIRNIDGSTTSINMAISSSSSRRHDIAHRHRTQRIQREQLQRKQREQELQREREATEAKLIAACQEIFRNISVPAKPDSELAERCVDKILALKGSYPKSKRKRSDDRGDEVRGPSGTQRRKIDHLSSSEKTESERGSNDDGTDPKPTGRNGTANGLPARDY
ncbi:hypothetical protein BG004_000733, partial [Podila humilis]